MVGRAARDVKSAKLSPKDKAQFKKSTAKEWSVGEAFAATRELETRELKLLSLDKPYAAGRRPPRVIGTRWVRTWKQTPDGIIAKSRHVV